MKGGAKQLTKRGWALTRRRIRGVGAAVVRVTCGKLGVTKLFLPTVSDDPALRCGKCDGCGCRPSLPPLPFTALTGPDLTSDDSKARVTSQSTINLRAFGHKLYSCQNGGTIQVFNHDLTPMHTWCDPEEWGNVNDVTELPTGQIAVAGSNGLFLVSAGGRRVSALRRHESFCSCASVKRRLVACSNSQRTIYEYSLHNNVWTQTYSIPQEISPYSWIKLAVSDTNVIIGGCSNPDIIFEVTEAGTLPQRRVLGKERRYLLCAADEEGSILAIDKRNGDLKVSESGGDWQMFRLEPPVRSPKSAVVIKNKLCVAADDGERLVLYTSSAE